MRECLFKCQTGKVIVGVYKNPLVWSMHGEPVYRVYAKRKWLWHQNWYRYKDALEACIHEALLGNYNVNLERTN